MRKKEKQKLIFELRITCTRRTLKISRNKKINCYDMYLFVLNQQTETNKVHEILPGTCIRRTARNMPVLKRRENRLQLAIIRDGRRSVLRSAEWYHDIRSTMFVGFQSRRNAF